MAKKKGWELLKERVVAIKDRPLTPEREKLLVDRESEMATLAKLPEYFEGGIVGVAGERGIGKTSLFNLVRFPGREKVIINVVDRESKAAILMDIVGELKAFAARSLLKEAQAKLEELASHLALYVALPTALGKVEVGVERMGKVKPFKEIVKELSKVLQGIGKGQKLVVVLDEIDKERKEELLKILDAIKDGFKDNAVTLMVALPYSIYEEVQRGISRGKETFNLENVFDYVVSVERLSNSDIEEIIRRHIGKLIEEEALVLLVNYARGNPRRAIRALKEAGILAVEEGKELIEEKHAKAVVRKHLQSLAREVGERGMRVLKAIVESRGVREAISLAKVSAPTFYKELERLASLELVEGQSITPLGRLLLEVFR